MYTLLTACNIVRKTDDSAGRMKVFMSVLRNSRKIRYSYTLYQHAPAAVKAALIVLYGAKCYLSLAWQGDDEQQLVFFASYPNERNVLNHVRNNLDTIQHGEVTISLQNCLRFGALADIAAFVPAMPRLYRYAKNLVRRHDFMPACRIFSTVTYYMRFKRLLAGSDVKAAFIACQYSPECLGLAAATHKAGKKVLFTNHASATGETGYVAPLYADLVAVTSQAMADLYQRHTSHDLDIVPLTIAAPQQSMRMPDRDADALTAGIYLTALTDESRLQKIVSELSQLPSIGSVFIRTHPARVVNADLSGIAGEGRPIEISDTRPLPEDIARTDIAVCGNSTVVIEILRGGRPVLYDHKLDHLVFDYNGYAGHGLVLPYPETLNDSVLDQIRRHYLNRDWLDKMSYFDSSYQIDETAMLQRFQAAVAGILQQA
jgi:hypothetical protein